MATQTALDLITASLKRLGVISGIETPSADVAEDSLARLNDLLGTWRTESLSLWTLRGMTLPPRPLNGIHYVMGPGPGADVPFRPERVVGVSLILPGTPPVEYPLIPLSDEEWRLERVKGVTTSHATHFFYNRLWPQALLRLWPLLTAGNVLNVGVYHSQEIDTVPTLTTAIDFPPGYFRALRDWLAIELAPEMGRPVDSVLLQTATDAKAQLSRVNFAPRELHQPGHMPTVCHGAYDWRTDT